MNKIHTIAITCAIAASASVGVAAQTNDRYENLSTIAAQYRPGVTGFGKVAADTVEINDSKRTISVRFNENAAYLPLTQDLLDKMKAECLESFGTDYKKYKIKLFSGKQSLDNLVLYAKKKNIAPKEKTPFITRHDKAAAPAGLDGANIALWQSHGWYFEQSLNRWEWQRARIFQTVEDLYTQGYVMPFLMPMLENAGAYVMSPRERDIQTTEIIVDNDGNLAKGNFATTGEWSTAEKPAFGYTKAELHNYDNPFREGSALVAKLSGKKDQSTASATWKASVPEDGNYAVYVSYTTLENSTDAAQYKVYAADGEHAFTINQKMGGGTWIYLGHFPFRKADGEKTVVEILNTGKNKRKVITADAVKIGGGMGNVARKITNAVDGFEYDYQISGYPRFVEGARYFLQWAGAPDSVYSTTNYKNDYTDDYCSRAHWVNWIAGGSSMLPDREGLNIPVDLSFAFHSDAGTTMNDSIIGTLGIYCTRGETTGNGSSRLASRDLTDAILTDIVNDVRANYEPNWTRRGMWDKSYFEARVPEVPGMLLELLSHQNFADMGYGLDPTFRFTVSRAVYKGMLKYIANRDGRAYVVQPLPVNSFAIQASGANNYNLTWQATEDKAESTAVPTYYIIEERIGDGAFRTIGKSDTNSFNVAVNDSEIHSYRIVAANDGGVSFPSEVLALCNVPGSKATVTIVNGFTRVGAPDRFDSGEIAGFYDARDHGVPYINDISYIGSQVEFRRNIPWMDDDAAGFGASRGDYEEKVIAGNTFDFVYTHGQAIRAAGHSFISTSVAAFCNSTDTPEMVDLILGKQKEIKQGRGAYGTHFKTFPTELQNRITALTAGGTDFFISGSYVATDLWDNPCSTKEVAETDQKFASEVLGYKWRAGQASITGEARQVQTRFGEFSKGEYTFCNKLSADCYAVESPDSFYASDAKKGCTFMRYNENNLVAGTIFDNGNYRTVVIGFPFETIQNQSERDHLMKQVLNFFAK